MGSKIIKKDSKERLIVVLNDEEKTIRAALSERLTSVITLPECVYSYVKGKSVKQAINSIKENIDKFKYFLKCDIKSYFDSVDLNILEEIIKERSKDTALAKEIKSILMEDNESYKVKGIILGSPLSNHLSNLYLIDFDEKFNRMSGIMYFRFCDDMFFLFNENIDIPVIENELKKLNLSLNKNKMCIGSYGDIVEYLGATISKGEANVYENEVYDNKNEETLNKESNKTQEEVLQLFKENKETLTDICEIDEFRQWVFNNLNKEYEYIFRYYFNGENKDELIEEMLDGTCYKEVYIFEEALNKLDNDLSLYQMFIKKFIRNNYEQCVFLKEETLEHEIVKIGNDEALIKSHINGEISLGQRLNYEGKSSFLIIDIDNKNNLKKAREMAESIKGELENRGILSYIEFSGNKGYHVWILFNKEIHIEKLNSFAQCVLNAVSIKRNKVEIIPRYNSLSKTEEIIKLPLGVHPISKKKGYFLHINSLEEIVENEFIDGEESISNFWNDVNNNFSDIYYVANKCSIIKKIIEYGLLKKHMSHFNRLVLTYIFPNLEGGDEFIHFIMEHLNNYSHSITKKFILKAPEHTISCRKLKEYFKDTDFQCSQCVFNKIGVYNTPILHSESEDVVLTSTKNQVKDILDEIIKLQHDKKDIVAKIKKLEKKLNKIYEELGSEAIELPLGKLNKNNDKWIIEIEV